MCLKMPAPEGLPRPCIQRIASAAASVALRVETAPPRRDRRAGRAGTPPETGAPAMPTPVTRPASGRATGPDPREAILPLVPHLRGYARALTGDVPSADDLVQDTLVLA